jgi:hypothetical protein
VIRDVVEKANAASSSRRRPLALRAVLELEESRPRKMGVTDYVVRHFNRHDQRANS